MPISRIETDSLASTLVAPTATALTTASGSAPSYSARAWVNFNGTGTVAIRASGNVTSITDNGVGDYTVNFATAMPDVNYCVTQFVRSDGTSNSMYVASANSDSTKTASALKILTRYGNSSSFGVTDLPEIGISIFG